MHAVPALAGSVADTLTAGNANGYKRFRSLAVLHIDRGKSGLFTMPVSGGCICQNIRYTLDYPRTPATYACHCDDCQIMSGASYQLQMVIPKARMELKGELTTWSYNLPEGTVTHYFCAVCKTRIYNSDATRADTIYLRGGTLDNSPVIVPSIHIWTAHMQPWIILPPNAESYHEAAPPERMRAVLTPNFARKTASIVNDRESDFDIRTIASMTSTLSETNTNHDATSEDHVRIA